MLTTRTLCKHNLGLIAHCTANPSSTPAFAFYSSHRRRGTTDGTSEHQATAGHHCSVVAYIRPLKQLQAIKYLQRAVRCYFEHRAVVQLPVAHVPGSRRSPFLTPLHVGIGLVEHG